MAPQMRESARTTPEAPEWQLLPLAYLLPRCFQGRDRSAQTHVLDALRLFLAEREGMRGAARIDPARATAVFHALLETADLHRESSSAYVLLAPRVRKRVAALASLHMEEQSELRSALDTRLRALAPPPPPPPPPDVVVHDLPSLAPRPLVLDRALERLSDPRIGGWVLACILRDADPMRDGAIHGKDLRRAVRHALGVLQRIKTISISLDDVATAIDILLQQRWLLQERRSETQLLYWVTDAGKQCTATMDPCIPPRTI